MITTVIIHNKCDDDSQSQQNLMTMPITFLIKSSHQIHFDQKFKSTATNKTQAFFEDRLTIELDNSSTSILTKQVTSKA
jgi:hypothetical protein